MNNETYLSHHGVKGQKWGVRRYVDEKGKITEAGRKRYSGKHGTAKYIYDTNPQYLKKRKIAFYGDRALGAGLVGFAAKTGFDDYGGNRSTKERALSALTLGAIAAGVVAAGTRVAEANWNRQNIREIENSPAMYPQIQDAQRYLRSQGINA